MRSYRPTHDALAGLVSQITMLSSDALEGLLTLVAQYEPSHVANCSYDEVELDLERLQPLTLMAVAHSQFSLNRSPLAKAALPQSHEVQRRRVSLIGRLFASSEPRDPIYQPPPLHPKKASSKRSLADTPDADDPPTVRRADASESMTHTILISMRPDELASVASSNDATDDEENAGDDPEHGLADPRIYEMLKKINRCLETIQAIKADVHISCVPEYTHTTSTSL
ncbi:hypothetical protein SPRG_16877 [Saprolegnia parasitica CBS 223.65]|uniref:NET domain-containing protein n=1 Tax=Saprolegnia parasitica (strain CBS 223.65) TaxID=695850 RepID=A0A067BSW7_SAPPC|nr:hypothetical protein SPRG_16877 [Saprolegnia parasitica CBS 223.65]KDO17712.1 hypothetical protein SPRG_16877 [Saprolegnia parasitica CBS 223.65]|eukprot:XP_012211579.1 hypothetical protein SPRG_16877 [Saprolegnia parasitica CBS 223.65]